MHKLVNGEPVELTPEEEQKIQEQWEKDTAEAALAFAEKLLWSQKKEEIREKVSSILGVTIDELREALKPD